MGVPVHVVEMLMIVVPLINVQSPHIPSTPTHTAQRPPRADGAP